LLDALFSIYGGLIMIRFFGLVSFALVLVGILMLAGCGPAVGGPRFWWNDQERKRMPADYVLPPIGQEMPESEAKTNADTEPVAPVKTDDPAKKSSSAGAVPRGLQ